MREGSSIGLNPSIITQLEEEKRKAEEDKYEAIAALEQASKSYLDEREEKKKLEAKIAMMNSKMLVGGQKIEETIQFKKALEKKENMIMKELEIRLEEIEKEKNQVEEEKAQIDKYKELLVKQRDIMIGFSAKLNERDEAIVQLQEELEAYERIAAEQEEAFHEKELYIQALENAIKRAGVKLPDNRPQNKKTPSKNKELEQELERKDREIERLRQIEESPSLMGQLNKRENELLVKEEEVFQLSEQLESIMQRERYHKSRAEGLKKQVATEVKGRFEELIQGVDPEMDFNEYSEQLIETYKYIYELVSAKEPDETQISEVSKVSGVKSKEKPRFLNKFINAK